APFAAACVLAAQAFIAVAVLAWGAHAARRLTRTGRGRWVDRAQRGAATARILATLIFAFGVLALGWLDAVRAAIGDWILLDELAAVAPSLAVFFASWMSFAPTERILWQTSLVRA